MYVCMYPCTCENCKQFQKSNNEKRITKQKEKTIKLRTNSQKKKTGEKQNKSKFQITFQMNRKFISRKG